MTRLPSSQPRRFIVIPSFDQPDQTTRCVEGLLSHAPDDFTVLVIDHGHTSWMPPPTAPPDRLEIVKAGTELWWAGATNVGIRHALAGGAESVMLLNADCALNADTAHRLFHTAETGNRVVAPVQIATTTRTVVSAGTLPFLTLGFPTFWERTHTGGLLDQRIIIRGGRGAVVPATVFDQVGLLAEDELPHYLADHDFFIRCRRAGVDLAILKDMSVLVDDTRTSTAHQPRALSWPEFKASLSDPRSHRSLATVRAFFRRNYPIRQLHYLGTALYLARYTLSWGIRRAVGVVRPAS